MKYIIVPVFILLFVLGVLAQELSEGTKRFIDFSTRECLVEMYVETGYNITEERSNAIRMAITYMVTSYPVNKKGYKEVSEELVYYCPKTVVKINDTVREVLGE